MKQLHIIHLEKMKWFAVPQCYPLNEFVYLRPFAASTNKMMVDGLARSWLSNWKTTLLSFSPLCSADRLVVMCTQAGPAGEAVPGQIATKLLFTNILSSFEAEFCFSLGFKLFELYWHFFHK